MDFDERGRKNPLGHLGDALNRTFSSLATASEIETKIAASRSASPVGALNGKGMVDEVDDQPTFSISSWKARFRQYVSDCEGSKCDDERTPYDKVPSKIHSQNVRAIDPHLRHAQIELPSKSSLVQWLLEIFQARDTARIEHTVLTLKSLAEADDEKEVEDVLHVYKGSLLMLTREGWRMLSARYSMRACSEASLVCTPRPVVEPHSERSSCCQSMHSSCCDIGHGKRGGTHSSTVSGSSGWYLETSTTELDIDCTSGRSDHAWSDTASVFGHLLNVTDFDTDDGHHDCALSSSDTCRLERTPDFHDNRDDWELHYILNTVLEEVRSHLEVCNTQLIGRVLETARVRIFTWTVHRWCVCKDEIKDST